MPTILDRYFYLVETGDDAYTRTPNGPPVVSRLIKGKSDVWISPQGQAMRPKTLLLDGAEFGFDTEIGIVKKTKVLRELLNHQPPFDIHIWFNNQFLKLSNDNLFLLKTLENKKLKKARKAPSKLQEKFALEQGLSIDAIAYIDSHDLLEIQSNDACPFTIHLHEAEPNDVIRFYNHSSRHPLAIFITDWELSIDSRRKLQKHFKQAKFRLDESSAVGKDIKAFKDPGLSASLKEIVLTKNQDLIDAHEIIKMQTQLESLSFLGFQYHPLSGSKPFFSEGDIVLHDALLILKIHTLFLQPIEIHALISSAPSLEVLHIRFNAIWREAFPLQDYLPKKCESLRSLFLLEDQATPQFNEVDFEYLMGQCPNLQELTVTVKALPEHMLKRLLPTSFAGLCNVTLSIETIYERDLFYFLSLTPKLHTLNLDFYEFTLAPSRIKNLTRGLNHLEILSLNNKSSATEGIGSCSTTWLLNQTTRLQHLTLSHLNLYEHELKKLNKLTQIKSIDISHSSSDRRGLSTLLSATTNLEKLKLSQVMRDVEWPILPSLKELTLSQVYFNSKDEFMILLSRLPMLEKASFYDLYFKSTTPVTATDARLSKLIHVDFNYTCIDHLSLVTLLNQTENLKTLNFRRCTLDTTGTPSLCHLHRLTALSLDTTNLSTNLLISLLDNATSIQVLSFTSVKCSDDLTLKTSLPSLRYLIIVDMFMLKSSFENLLHHMPNLERLDLTKFWASDTTENHPPLHIPPMPNLKRVDLSQTNLFSLKDIAELFRNAPNLERIKVSERTYIGLEEMGVFDSFPTFRQKCVVSSFKEYFSSKIHSKKPHQAAKSHTQHQFPRLPYAQDPHFNTRHHQLPSDKKDKPFQFRKPTGTHNQGEIINLLSQYLNIQGHPATVIQSIQDGICQALSQLFVDLSDKEWQQFKEIIFSWNGEPSKLHSKHDAAFRKLLDYVKKYQLSRPLFQTFTYAGDALIPYLIKKHPSPIQLQNEWHRIALKYNSKRNCWVVYDPNFVSGEKQEITDVNLSELLLKSIGPVVSLSGSHPIPEENTISDFDTFFENGGFFTLFNSFGHPLLRLIDLSRDYTDGALDGLLLLDTQNQPAWSKLLLQPSTNNLAQVFLQKLMMRYPDDYQAMLDKSMRHLTPELKAKTDRALNKVPLLPSLPIQSDAQKPSSALSAKADVPKRGATAIQKPTVKDKRDDPALPSAEIDERERLAVQEAAMKAHQKRQTIERYLKDRQAPPPSFDTPAEMISCLFQCGDEQKPPLRQLIEYDGYGPLHASIIKMLDIAKQSGKPIFLVNSPEDLACTGPWIEKTDDHSGIIHDEPGGPLFRFMQQHAGNEDALIVVNYANFKPKDIVRFNTLIDAERLVDGVPIPDNIRVLALSDISSPNAYQGGDFYSRFDKRFHNPFDEADWQANLATPPHIPSTDQYPAAQDVGAALSPFIIACYGAKDWEDILLGSWQLDGDKLIFQPGALESALQSNRPILIQNGPWQDKRFELFWERLIIDQGYNNIPLTQTIQRAEGYDWTPLKAEHKANYIDPNTFKSAPYLLSPLSVNEFIATFRCEDKHLIKAPGILQQHLFRYPDADTRPPLTVLLTRAISDSDWARLLHEANEKSVTLYIQVLPTVTLPKSLNAILSLGDSPPSQPSEIPTPIILTNDIDARVELMLHQEEVIVIDATECDSSDLLLKTDATYHKASHRFSFESTEQVILTALKSQKKIILKGPISDELYDALTPFFRDYPAERLTLVTDQELDIPALPHQIQLISVADKQMLLGKDATQFDESEIEQTPYVKLQSIVNYRRTHADRHDLEAAWEGQERLSIKFELGDFTPDTAEAESLAFMAKRMEILNRAFETSPVVCLSGITGVGKSTFMEKILAKTHLITMGEDPSALLTWIKKAGVLFIDEANITARGWSEFEGLFNRPPTFLLNGELYTLTDKHKVIFAFNPSSYSSERETNRLFKRHGNTVVFDPLPLNVIFHDILSPLFKGTPLEKSQVLLAKPILDAYALLTKASTDRVLVSARELKSIVMMAVAHQENQRLPEALLPALIKHYTKQILSPLLPEYLSTEFLNLLKDEHAISSIHPPHDSGIECGPDTPLGNYLITPSRQESCDSLNAFLSLRLYRREKADRLNEAQIFGGLGGVIMEGEPGIGKSVLAQKILMDWGLHEGSKDQENVQENVYYVIPASLSNTKKRQLLLKAFDEGAPVIMDEMNSASMLERTLNDLLMGKHPDEHRRAKQPGFIIIGTQNPITMKGRVAASQALNRRVAKIDLPHYPEHEMIEILQRRGLETSDANSLVQRYMEERSKAKQKDSTIPNFRDLMAVAKQLIEDERRLQVERERLLRVLSERADTELATHVDLDAGAASSPIFQNFNIIQLRILAEIQERGPSIYQRLTKHEKESKFINETLELYELCENSMMTVKQLCDLKDIDLVDNLELTQTYCYILSQSSFNPMERRQLSIFLKSIDVSNVSTPSVESEWVKLTSSTDYEARLLIKILQQPFPELTSPQRIELITDTLLAWSHSPSSLGVPQAMISLHLFIRQTSRLLVELNDRPKGFFSLSHKDKALALQTAIDVATSLYQYLKDPDSGFDPTPNEEKALTQGELAKIIEENQIKFPNRTPGPDQS